jgi:hypothetical protein
MAGGGKREGAGRPRGTPNKATAAKVAEVAASGLTPLDYLLGVMRDEGLEEPRRTDAAKAAAPFVHPKLSNIDANVNGDIGITVEIVRFSDDDES